MLPITPGAFKSQAASNLDALVGRLELRARPDAFISFGTACPGSLATPQLVGTALPRICRSLVIEASGWLPQGKGRFIIGFDRSQFGGMPLPLSLASLGAAGCNLLVAPDRTYARFADNMGNSSLSVPVPDIPGILGLEVFCQCASVDPAANVLAVTMSNEVRSNVRW